MSYAVLPDAAILELIQAEHVTAAKPIPKDFVQPTSLDLRLGHQAWHLRASFLPGSRSTVEDKVPQLAWSSFEIADYTILEPGAAIYPTGGRLTVARWAEGETEPTFWQTLPNREQPLTNSEKAPA